MSKIEILSPAGGFDSVVAAVRSGADAVYLGAKDFSARASAHNFDIDELQKAVKYCHTSGVKVYLALNTLIFDDEMDKALELVKSAARCDIDALITQDIGLAMAVKRVVPNLRLHASTQMSVHTLCGAQALYEMGFSRVVLAREMTKTEIKHIADNCPIELEVFVHGALCMSVSGGCYISAMLGSRSANRGMCAQPCRLPFTTDNTNTHALSLKDNSIIEYIRELEEIGVTSAKIEGRMKRPEYVATATKACVQSRDEGEIDSKTSEQLQAVFSRTGFTDGYYCDARGHNMFGYRKRADVVSASEKLLREIRSNYKDELGRVDVQFDVQVAEGDYTKLTVTDGTHTVCVTSNDVSQTAQSAPVNKEKIAGYLSKTGDTPYTVTDIKCDIVGNAFVSAKDINALRRNALAALSQKREKWHNYEINDIGFFEPVTSGSKPKSVEKTQRARVCDLNIPHSFCSMEYVFVPLFDCVKNVDTIARYQDKGISIAVEIPRGMFSREKQIETALNKAKAMGITHVMCHNIGAAYLCKKLGLVCHLGFGMNIVNSLSLRWAKDFGAQDVELSFEMDIDRINNLKGDIKRGVIAYGYLPLMMTRNCPAKSGTADCATCKNGVKMQDRKGEQFTLFCDKNVVEILNCVPLILPLEIYKSKNLDFTVFHFSVENSVENKEKILKNLSEKRNFSRFTHGLYLRGVK